MAKVTHLELLSIVNKYPRIKQLCRQLASFVPPSMRLGSGFWTWYAFFEESEHWTMGEMHGFQLERLRHLLANLKRTSRFYEEHLRDVDIDSISSLDDYSRKVPELTRYDFRRNYSRLLGSPFRQNNLAAARTSGTTGAALQFYHHTTDSSRQWAAICHQWKRVGYDPANSKVAQFRGLTRSGQLIEPYPNHNVIRCSILHLQPEHLRCYSEAIRKSGIEFYHVYPSALFLISDAVLRSGITFPQPKGILFASENVYDWQLDKISSVFPNARLFSHYGCAERTVLAAWCEYRHEYHVLPQYALVEIDRTNSEIIGTNLFNTINGFVRYRMTDTVLESVKDTCPDCRRPYIPRLTTLGGRLEDYLYSPDRGWIPPAIVTYPFKSLISIRETQLRQDEKNEVTILYSTDSLSTKDELESDRRKIIAGMHHLLGSSVTVQFKQVDGFSRTSSGKFKWIVSNLEGPLAG